MTLAANVLNAIGGKPQLDGPDFIPRYPAYLPHSARAFQVSLQPFSPASLETFMLIERPGEIDAPAEDEEYDTIGQFYLAIENGLRDLVEELGEEKVFTGKHSLQITPDCFDYHASGHLVRVVDLDSALKALEEIVDQGEGLKHKEVWDGDIDMFHPERGEVAHYFRFMEIKTGHSFQLGDTPESGPTGDAVVVDWDAVYPMKHNVRTQDLKGGSDVVAKMGEFNMAYSDVLRDLQRAFNGERDRLTLSIPAMRDLSAIAREIVQMPIDEDGTTASPSFEYLPAAAAPMNANENYKIKVTKDGPYVVTGGVPLNRKSIVYSEQRYSLTWRKDETLESDATYRLCRCGQSKSKPFCDNTHARIGFDGTENPPKGPSAARARRFEGKDLTMTDDSALCVHAAFCDAGKLKVWEMVDKTDDENIHFELMQRIECCPGGKLGYEVDGKAIEPDLPEAISATKDGPLWVAGGIPVQTSDGQTQEVRNRVTLCRCGHSNVKPFCDGSHKMAGFED